MRIETELKAALELAESNTEELKEELINLNEKYNKAVEDLTKPFWKNLDTYIGIAAGVIIVSWLYSLIQAAIKL
jgi:hypothetical protein